MGWVIDNKEWIFSGVGIFLISTTIVFLFKKRSSVNQFQKSGKNSTNYQSAGDIKIGRKND
ncbi:MAG: hypothetical protein JW902_02550 [Syntrophaceae bacterium]|nr:hypothetical protein [Syntrophaceae bacterium]